MKTKNKKLLKSFDNEETFVYQIYHSPSARSIYFNEKPNKAQLKNIAEKHFDYTSQEEIDKIDYDFSIDKIKVFNLN
jgi:hypothetical protein